jgi:hypothetical protein
MWLAAGRARGPIKQVYIITQYSDTRVECGGTIGLQGMWLAAGQRPWLHKVSIHWPMILSWLVGKALATYLNAANLDNPNQS